MFLSFFSPRSMNVSFTRSRTCSWAAPDGEIPPGSQILSSRACNIHPVTHQVAIGLFHNVPKMDANAKLDTTFGQHARVALDHAGLHLDRTAHGIDHAAELE